MTVLMALPLLLATLPQDGDRLVTDRTASATLSLPDEDEAFVFAIFGDRTGGPAAGVSVLADAVDEVNLLDPDLVMTVGDLIEGYNTTPRWMDQMREYRGIMDRLTCPWFPVAGNHDVYWRGEGRPEGEHEASYEEHFGPLWYAFEHKDCWFIALYTDEGDPVTGAKTFREPASQKMSEEQMSFLDSTLRRAADARHVFVFLHHPRWHGGGYGEDWERVHTRLAKAGNVRAVFAGHIHRMLYDGERDGIEYFTLATVGGHQSGVAPRAGYLHHYNLVTVRDEGLSMIALPVGAAIDPRTLTRQLSDEARSVARISPRVQATPTLSADGTVSAPYVLELRNPVSRDVELELSFESTDSDWDFVPEHAHFTLAPGESKTLEILAFHAPATIGRRFALPQVVLQADYLAADHRLSLPVRTQALPLDPGALRPPARPAREWATRFDGRTSHVKVASEDLSLPDGPLTLETWLRADGWSDRVGVVCKTETSGFGIFANGGVPDFMVHLDGNYVSARAQGKIPTDRWTHVAGVYDGEEVRLYVDGELAARTTGSGTRSVRPLPLIVGADVDSSGRATSHFRGDLDEVRISTVARYTGPGFTPQRRHEPDDSTSLLLHLDVASGPWAFDASARRAHGIRVGDPENVPASTQENGAEGR